MASLREHVEMKEQVAVINVSSPPPPQQQQQQQHRAPRGSGLVINRRVAIVAGVALVGLVGVAATMAVFLSGGSEPAPAAASARAHPAHAGPHDFGAYHEIADRAMAMQAEMVLGRYNNKGDTGYHKEEVLLEEDEEEGHDDSLPPAPVKVHHPRQYPQHPSYAQEEVELEVPEEHDSRRRPVGVDYVDVPQTKLEMEEKVEVPKDEQKEEKVEENNQEVSVMAEEDQEEKNKEQEDAKKAAAGEATQEQTADRFSPRLPHNILPDGRAICATPECSVAATQISESLDLTTSPCDDFYQFACGGWLDKHPVPEDGATGNFDLAADTLDTRLHLILETPAEPADPEPLHMIRTFYDTCKDTDTMDSLGMTPLWTALQTAQGGWPMVMDAWDPATFDLYTALDGLRDLLIYPLLSVGIDLDITNTSTYILYVDTGTVPLGVGVMSSPSQTTLDAARTYMAAAARLLRDELGSTVSDLDIELQVQEVLDFEIAFSLIVEKAVNETTNHAWRTDVAGLQADTEAGTPGTFDWLSYLRAMFAGTGTTIDADEPVISFKSNFFADFSDLLAITSPKVLANFLGWNWAYEMGQELNYEMRNASLEFWQAAFGVQQFTDRWMHCMDETNYNLGFALSREYVDEFMASSTKPEVAELVEDLREGFSSLLDNNTWMLPADLLVAREKLAAIDPFVAYPDWIMDDAELTLGYEGLTIISDEEFDNLKRIGAWYNFNRLVLLREIPQHSFLIPPTIVNAFYNPQENTITILAGILQYPFFAHNSLAALNYGGIGMVIGHEMTHGFDNTGRLFDKDGNAAQWWSNETVAAYNDRASCFVDQYNNYIPPEVIDAGLNVSVDGMQTLGENIADNGGLREAYRAYRIYVARYGEEPRLPGLDEFSPDHLFYLGYASLWCENKSPTSFLNQLARDPHSPGRFRVMGPVTNDAEFSRVWNCPAGAPMNAGDERCLLW